MTHGHTNVGKLRSYHLKSVITDSCFYEASCAHDCFAHNMFVDVDNSIIGSIAMAGSEEELMCGRLLKGIIKQSSHFANQMP